MTEELKAKARRIWEEIFPSGDVGSSRGSGRRRFDQSWRAP